MKQTILTTVGTSLLTNRERPWATWRHGQPLPAAAAVDHWLRNADPIKASAETHTWHRLGLFDAEEENAIEVVLVHSQTPDGQFCAERLVAMAQAKQLRARRRQVDGLNYSDGESFNKGLRQFARVIGEETKRGRASGTVELAATGGFKAEIAIANLVGAISDTSVHYIYEQFTSLITIAPLPVSLRADWIGGGAGRKLLAAFESADDLVRVADIESLLKQDERLLTLVEIAGSDAALSLLGEMALRLLETPETWPPVTDIPPHDKKHFDAAAHHRPRGWEQIVDVIANSRYVTSIRYDGLVSGGCLKEAADNESDLIHRIEGEGVPPLKIRIRTTATTAGQRRLVQQLLLKELERRTS